MSRVNDTAAVSRKMVCTTRLFDQMEGEGTLTDVPEFRVSFFMRMRRKEELRAFLVTEGVPVYDLDVIAGIAALGIRSPLPSATVGIEPHLLPCHPHLHLHRDLEKRRKAATRPSAAR